MNQVHNYESGCFDTYSGIKMDLINTKPEMIEITDIAAGLSKICRFGGQSKEFYSVAQHSVLVCRLAPEHLKFAALMHDASEAYLGDVIKPLKHIIGKVYDDIEERFMKLIARKYNINMQALDAIKPCDMQALEMEHDFLLKGNIANWENQMNKLGLGKDTLLPRLSRIAFLSHFNHYSKILVP